MNFDNLLAVSPIDGRYANKCPELREVFSEYGLVKRRVLVECTWLEALCDAKEVREGFDCGLVFEGFDAMQVDDIIEAYDLVEVPRD